MADFGPASNNAETNVGNFPTAVFLEIHTQNNVQSAITSGVPGGTAGPASALNNLGPADHNFQPSQAYGTVPSGAAVTAVNIQSSIVANPVGAGQLQLFRMKNPAVFEFQPPEF